MGLQTFATGEALRVALGALADAVRAGRIRKLELERVDGEPVLGGATRAAAGRARLPQRPATADAAARSGHRDALRRRG